MSASEPNPNIGRYGFRRINDDIIATLGRPGKWYLAILAFCLVLVAIGAVCWGLIIWTWHRRHQPEQPGGLGPAHHHLRVLGRHRPRGHADFGDPLPLARALADRHLPRRRDHHHLRGHDRGPVPAHPPRSRLGRVLHPALPERPATVAELPLAAGVGRAGHHHLSHGQPDLLLRGSRARHRGGARPGQGAGLPDSCSRFSRSAGKARSASGSTTWPPTSSSRPWPRRS